LKAQIWIGVYDSREGKSTGKWRVFSFQKIYFTFFIKFGNFKSLPTAGHSDRGCLLMYLDFHGFREKPFNQTPDPRFVFLSKNHKEAFAHLLYGINNRVGFIALTGEVGSGKTTVLRALLSQLETDHHRTALIFNPRLSPSELLQNINMEFGIPDHIPNRSSPLDVLNQFLLKENAEGRIAILVIDEAQNLEAPVLEQIRLISNLETDREKLIQIILSGQTELDQILKRNEMRQLSQRITVRYHLKPMDFPDTAGYISHRLEVAGARNGALFTKRALKRIYRYSGGLPRLINAACDRALLTSYTRDKVRVSSRIAALGIRDIKKSAVPSLRRWRLILIPTFVILVSLFVVSLYFDWDDVVSLFNAAPQREVSVLPETEEQPKAPLITGEELFRIMAVELGEVPESESAGRAFNVLANLWNVPSISESTSLNQPIEIERAALDRGLRMYRFSGNMGALLRIDYPAALELTPPNIPGKRFVILVGIENEQLVVDPSIAGRRSLSFSEIEKHWSGNGFLLWKDPLNLLTNHSLMSPGSKGVHVKRLQGLLKEAGFYRMPLTGVYEGNTVSAVKEFQSSMGIEQDGIVGVQTLMFLYRSIDRFEVPKLAAEPK
jgi:general secretion pathway protein A